MYSLSVRYPHSCMHFKTVFLRLMHFSGFLYGEKLFGEVLDFILDHGVRYRLKRE